MTFSFVTFNPPSPYRVGGFYFELAANIPIALQDLDFFEVREWVYPIKDTHSYYILVLRTFMWDEYTQKTLAFYGKMVRVQRLHYT
jgi:hypothetical protein